MPERGIKQKGEDKTARVIRLVARTDPPLRKPEWIRVRAGDAAGRFGAVRKLLRARQLHSVCEEAACPNMGECFGRGVATFMILGDICTRRCPFCDVGHGLPLPLDADEPARLARCVAQLALNHVVITSVDRDDLKDGGAAHFAAVVAALRHESPEIRIELLTPDFRGRLELALERLGDALPDVLNHNLETVPRLYRAVRPGADYAHSLKLLKDFRARYPRVPTKSGLMVGLGETDAEILAVLQDLRAHGVERLTIGQYLSPSRHHLPVERYVPPETFQIYAAEATRLGFTAAACAPMVRSSYRAADQETGDRAPPCRCAPENGEWTGFLFPDPRFVF
ncbi:MAG: lipoyl synthase [Zoogloeaceae bacterium]|jgi:lipoic acid synthetase|nr:lipoyl synthase [Zoogloeaceae bacterium]